MSLSPEAVNAVQNFQDGFIRGLMWDALVLVATLSVIGLFRWWSARR